jgi:hypothetical protein
VSVSISCSSNCGSLSTPACALPTYGPWLCMHLCIITIYFLKWQNLCLHLDPVYMQRYNNFKRKVW